MSEERKDAESYDEIVALIQRADLEDPDPADVAELKRVFGNKPDLWRNVGSLVRNAGGVAINSVSCPLSFKQATIQEYDAIRRDLGVKEAHGLEGLLIENVALCNLRLSIEEHVYNQRHTRDGMTFAQANFYDKRLDAAQRRFLRACETLARVRKITRQTVALQVNIAADGGKQVNVLGDVTQ